MFTGIIGSVGSVAALRELNGGARLQLSDVPFAGELVLGESVAVNGCCLTVVSATGAGEVVFDLLAETVRVTNLGACRPGELVNLERALRVGDRLSGHYVQGHIDTTGEVLDYSAVGQDRRLEIALAPEFADCVIRRGSVALDGISLTVAELGKESFVCWIIPHTAEVTHLRALRGGERLNIEFDLMGKYARRQRELAAK